MASKQCEVPVTLQVIQRDYSTSILNILHQLPSCFPTIKFVDTILSDFHQRIAEVFPLVRITLLPNIASLRVDEYFAGYKWD